MKFFLTIIGVISLISLTAVIVSVFAGTIQVKKDRAAATEQLPEHDEPEYAPPIHA